MNKYLKIKNLLKQLKCAECYGTGNYNVVTPFLNYSGHTIKGRLRQKFYNKQPDQCPGCEATGFNQVITIGKFLKIYNEY